jgi:hypothetical protein
MVVESEAVGRKNWGNPVSSIHLRRVARSSSSAVTDLKGGRTGGLARPGEEAGAPVFPLTPPSSPS